MGTVSEMGCRTFCIVRAVLAAVILLYAPVPAQAEPPHHPRALFISSYHPEFPSFFPQVRGLTAGLAEAGYARDKLTLDIEFMDTKRFPVGEMVPRFRAGLAAKLATLPPYDIVFVADDNAFEFALDNLESLFRGIPIVFLSVNNAKRALAQDANPMVVGVIERRSVEETLRLIERLYPAAEKVHVVIDNTRTGVLNRKSFESPVRMTDRLDIKLHSLAEETYAEFFEMLKRLPPGAPLFIDCSARDRDGRALDFYGFLRGVKAVFAGPVFAVQSHGLGYGLLGGAMVSHEEQGRAAAGLGAQILNGTPAASLKVIANSPNVFAFDYKEVLRLGIDPALLPPDARFINRPASVLHEYVGWMLGGIAFIAFQTFMIILLLLNIRQRRTAVTSLREATFNAERANRAKSEFLSRMSHELRTPLNAIIGFSEVLKRELLGPIGNGRYRGYAEDIHTSGAHLLAIINDVLEMTKVSAGEVRLHEQTLAARDLIDNAVMQVELSARKHGVILVREPGPEELRLRVDPRRITQILLNLLSNAIKFTPRGGTVGVGIRVGGDGPVEIRVSDTGIGMSGEDLAEIMLPFRQVETAFSTSHEGTGLGVPIALELARLHGGTLRYESVPGAGTTAALLLPAVRVVQPEAVIEIAHARAKPAAWH